MRRPALIGRAEAVCAAAILCLALASILAIQRTAITTDEVIHIAAGYYGLTAGEYRMNAEHPPLAKLWSALPLLAFVPRLPLPPEGPGSFVERGGRYNNRFWSANRDLFLSIGFWTRAAMLAFTLGLGVLVFAVTKMLFGGRAAAFAVVLYSLEPNILGHGKLVHTDIPAAFVYLLFFTALYLYYKRPGLLRAVLLALAAAIALLTKFSMLVLVPVLGLFFMVRMFAGQRSRAERFVHPLLVALVVVVVINAVYRFRDMPLDPGDVGWVNATSDHPQGIVRAMEVMSHIVPMDYLFGAYVVESHNGGGHTASVLGRYGHLGWWYYFPVAFALKTPLPFLLLSVASLGWALWRIVRHRDHAMLTVIAPLAIYAALAMSSHINIGIRHFLAVFPFLFILSGALLSHITQHAPRIGRAVSTLAIGVMFLAMLRTFPYYLSYFNELKGDKPSWMYLSDSNVEWGDAAPELASFLKDRGVTRIRGALLGGQQTLPFYGIEILDMYSVGGVPDTEYFALGASFLNGSTVEYSPADSRRNTEQGMIGYFASHRARKPLAVFGNSIYLYGPESQPR